MFAKKNVLAAAIMLFNDEILEEDEMFCVFSELNRKNPPFPYWNYDCTEKQMDDMSYAEIKSEFRFGHSELPLLAETLQIPQYFVCSNGTVASGMYTRFFGINCCLLGKIKANKTFFLVHEYWASLNI